MRGGVGVALALLVLVPLPASGGIPVHGTFRSHGDAVLQGELEGTMDVRAIRFQSVRDPGTATAVFHVRDALLELRNHPSMDSPLYGLAPDPCNPSRTPLDSWERTEWSGRFTGAVVVATDQPDADLAVGPLAASSLQVPLRTQGRADIVFGLDGAVGSLRAENATGGPFHADVEARIYGAHVSLLHGDGSVETVRTGRFANADCSTAWDYHDRLSLVVFAEEATVDLGSSSAGWRHEAVSLEGRLRGDLALEAVTADATVGQGALRDRHGLVQAIGDFRFGATYDGQGSSWRVDGTAGFVAVDARAWFGERPAWQAAAAAGGLGLVVAWLASRVWPEVLAFLGSRRAAPLGNATRVRVLQAIGEHPGSTSMDLARTTRLHRSTVKFHLSVLRRADLVDVQRQGRFEHFLLNSRSYQFPAQALQPSDVAPPPMAPTVFSSLRQKVRGLIFHTLMLAGEPLSYQGFLQACPAGEDRPKRTTFLHHAVILERQGILRRGRSGSQVTWAPNVDYAGMLRRQARTFLAEKDGRSVLDAVAVRGAATRQAVRDALRARGPEAWVDERLDALHAVGFLALDGVGAYSLNRRGAFAHLHATEGDP